MRKRKEIVRELNDLYRVVDQYRKMLEGCKIPSEQDYYIERIGMLWERTDVLKWVLNEAIPEELLCNDKNS